MIFLPISKIYRVFFFRLINMELRVRMQPGGLKKHTLQGARYSIFLPDYAQERKGVLLRIFNGIKVSYPKLYNTKEILYPHIFQVEIPTFSIISPILENFWVSRPTLRCYILLMRCLNVRIKRSGWSSEKKFHGSVLIKPDLH